jgi:Siphovirus ReqiPepy6 Gp37-like protein
MQVYILNSSLLRTDIIEQYESMIWTERYQAFGDFQLDIDPNLADAQLFLEGTYLMIDKSDRVMYIDSVFQKKTDDGTRVLEVKGKSLEATMMGRPNNYAAIGTGAAPTPLVLGPGLPAALMRDLFDDCCRNNTVVTTDNMTPFIQPDAYSSIGRIAEPATTVTIQTDIDTLYNTLKSIADVYNLGFRIRRPLDDSKIYFEVYTGFDRTASQTARDAVVFSSALDSLTDTTDLRTAENFKNVAYVFAPNGSRIVYANGGGVGTTSLEKKILIVSASDIDDGAGATLQTKLEQRGLEELAKSTVLLGFDGKVPQNSAYVYGTHYFLGDLVEKRSDKGTISQMLVTEQIFVSDKEGERAYPTLTLKSTITAGSWDAVAPARTWDSYTTETWDSM